ncbi:MAG TPA: hypothetical protein VIY48_17525 [Candidatus Paceibacterota bacterium]
MNIGAKLVSVKFEPVDEPDEIDPDDLPKETEEIPDEAEEPIAA